MGGEPKHIIEGFSDDVKAFAEKFPSRYPQRRLADFLKFWDEEHMDCLFANRFDPRELIEAISEMNQYLTELLVSPDGDAVKLIAIYLLLCIYIVQPERFRCKFRWTCQDLITIESWSNSQDNHSINLALKQLKALEAFELVEERKIYGPSMIRRGFNGNPPRACGVASECEREREETIEFLASKIEPIMAELRNIHELYDNFRQVILPGASSLKQVMIDMDSLKKDYEGSTSS